MAPSDGVDPRRVPSSDFSNGAFLAYRYALSVRASRAGVAVVEGALLAPSAPGRPVDLLVLHQAGDETVPLAGTDASTIPGDPVPLPSVAASRAAYLRGARCPTRAGAGSHGPASPARSCTVAGRRVETIVVPGGAHRWPTGADGVNGARTVTSFFGLDRR